jgi:hypothetical protein
VLASTSAVRRAVLAGVFAAGIVLCGWVLSERAQAAEAVPGVPTTGQPVAGDAVTAHAPDGPGTGAASGERSPAGDEPAHTPTGMAASAAVVSTTDAVTPAAPVSSAVSAWSGATAGPKAAAATTPRVTLPKSVAVTANSLTGRSAAGGGGTASDVGEEITDAVSTATGLGNLNPLGEDTVSLVRPPSAESLIGDLAAPRPTHTAPGGAHADTGEGSAVPQAGRTDVPSASPATSSAAESAGPRYADVLPHTAPEHPDRLAAASQPVFSAGQFLAATPTGSPRNPVPTQSATSSSDDAVAGSVHRADAPSALCSATAPAAPTRLARLSAGRSPNAGPHDRPGDVPVSPA